MAKPLLDDALWSKIEPLLPPQPPRLKGGRPRLPDRAALTGIVLRTGIPWEYLPKEMGCGSGIPAGAGRRGLATVASDHAGAPAVGCPDRLDACSGGWRQHPCPPGGAATGRNPTDRGKLGCKHHLAVDARGLLLVVMLSGANRHDSKCFIPVLEAIVPLRGLSGHPRRRPENA